MKPGNPPAMVPAYIAPVTATTTPEPTVGLVFYDLKSCLRAAQAPEGDAKPRPKARQKAATQEESGGEA